MTSGNRASLASSDCAMCGSGRRRAAIFARRLWEHWWLLPIAQVGTEVDLPMTVRLVMLVSGRLGEPVSSDWRNLTF